MDQVNQDLPDMEQPKPDCDEDEAIVHVERALLNILETEVQGLLNKISAKDGRANLRSGKDTTTCPFCVFREFRGTKHQGMGRFRQHIIKHHGGGAQTTLSLGNFVASGSKQCNVIRALYDQQIQARTFPRGLLEESASLMMSWLNESTMMTEARTRSSIARSYCA